MVDESDNYPLRCLAKSGIRDVHVLAAAVFGRSLGSDDENVRMFPCEPCGNGIGRRSHDDLDPGLVHGVEHAIDVAEVEDARLRFQRAPGGLGDAHDGDSGRLHHSDVFIETIRRRIFLVIGSAEEDRLLTFERLSAGLERVRYEKTAKTATRSSRRSLMKVTCTWKLDGIVSLRCSCPDKVRHSRRNEKS